MAYRPASELARPELVFDTHTVMVENEPTHLVSCVGAFAGDRVDGGAAALIEAMQIVPGSAVLDLGCGTGLAALAAARRGAHVTATDVAYRAVASARRTLSANDCSDVRVDHTHGAAAVEDGTYDTVVTNPPFHKGHDISFEVSEFFVGEAARVLRRGGELFLVANAFLDYEPWLIQHFANIEVVLDNRQYRVWHAVRKH